MAKVKIGPDDHEVFVAAAAAANISVRRWLVQAGRRQALADAMAYDRPGARIVPERLWPDAVAELRPEIWSAQQAGRLERCWIDTIVGGTVLLVVPDHYTRDVVESRLRPAIAETLSRLLGRRVQVAVTVEEERGVVDM